MTEFSRENTREPKLEEQEWEDQEIEEAYKNLRMTEIPPMWEEIERRLVPKGQTKAAEQPKGEGKRRRDIPGKTVRVLAPMAAAIAVVLIAVPVWHLANQGQSKDMEFFAEASREDSAGASQEEAGQAAGEEADGFGISEAADEADGFGISEAGDESEGAAFASEPGESEGEEFISETEESGGMESASRSGESEGTKSASEKSGDLESAAADQADGEDIFQATIQVKQIQESAKGLKIQGTVLEDLSGHYLKEAKVSIFYEGTEYGIQDFSDIVRLRLKKEENLKLLEILP